MLVVANEDSSEVSVIDTVTAGVTPVALPAGADSRDVDIATILEQVDESPLNGSPGIVVGKQRLLPGAGATEDVDSGQDAGRRMKNAC